MFLINRDYHKRKPVGYIKRPIKGDKKTETRADQIKNIRDKYEQRRLKKYAKYGKTLNLNFPKQISGTLPNAPKKIFEIRIDPFNARQSFAEEEKKTDY